MLHKVDYYASVDKEDSRADTITPSMLDNR